MPPKIRSVSSREMVTVIAAVMLIFLLIFGTTLNVGFQLTNDHEILSALLLRTPSGEQGLRTAFLESYIEDGVVSYFNSGIFRPIYQFFWYVLAAIFGANAAPWRLFLMAPGVFV